MAVRFTLYNNKIEFTDKQEEYNTLRLEYEDKATVAADKYLEFYYSCGSLDSFVEKGAKAGYEIVNEVINDFLTDIVNQGVYSITLKTIEDQYGNYYLKDFVSAFEEVQNQYMEIVLKGEALDAYRTARRENRARWSGGGFGLQGAIKGAATASVLNLAGGIAHGTFNMVAKGFTAIGNSFKKSSIYNSKTTKEALYDGIYWSVFTIHLAICDMLKLTTMPISSEKSDTLLENLARIKNLEKAKDLLTQALYLNPYNNDIYKYAVDHFKDSNGELQLFAEHFGRDEHLTKYKTEVIEQKLKEFNEKEYVSLEEIDVDILKLQSQKRELSISNNIHIPIEDHLYEIRKEIDLSMRTVNSIVFDTYAKANHAKEKLEAIEVWMKNIDNCSYHEAVSMYKKITNTYSKKEQQVLQEELDNLKDAIEDMCTVNSVVFSTYDEAIHAKEKEKDFLSWMQKITQYDYDELIAMYNNIQNTLTPKELCVVKKPINELKETIQKLDIERRTYKNILFDTFEEKVSAEEQDRAVTIIMEEVKSNNFSIEESKKRIEALNLPPLLLNATLSDIAALEIDQKLSDLDFVTDTQENYNSVNTAIQEVLNEYDQSAISISKNYKIASDFCDKYTERISLETKAKEKKKASVRNTFALVLACIVVFWMHTMDSSMLAILFVFCIVTLLFMRTTHLSSITAVQFFAQLGLSIAFCILLYNIAPIFTAKKLFWLIDIIMAVILCVVFSCTYMEENEKGSNLKRIICKLSMCSLFITFALPIFKVLYYWADLSFIFSIILTEIVFIPLAFIGALA